MGMSAGQARLLSITSRLSDNELRSQSITNAKLRLATESTDASKAYMEALNSTELVYRFYDDTGALSYCNLTPAFLYSYDSLKNQYSILIIAHRLSTIINCDRIMILENGKITDQGNHKELLDRNNTYKTLYQTEILK